MAARLNGLLNPILRSYKVYGSSLNYNTTLEGFSDGYSVKDKKIYHNLVTIFIILFDNFYD